MDNVENNSKHGYRYDTGPSVVVEADGERAAWNNGKFTGDSGIVKHARFFSDNKVVVDLHGLSFSCDKNDIIGATAAMCSYSPYRFVILEAPSEVYDELFSEKIADLPSVINTPSEKNRIDEMAEKFQALSKEDGE